jgi:hypothetical protein
MKGTAMRKYAAVIGILAGVAAIGMGLYVHSAQPKLGPSWHVIGILVTSPRLFLGVGVVMIVGGVLTLWNPAVGGVIVLAGAVLGLVYLLHARMDPFRSAQGLGAGGDPRLDRRHPCRLRPSPVGQGVRRATGLRRGTGAAVH